MAVSVIGLQVREQERWVMSSEKQHDFILWMIYTLTYLLFIYLFTYLLTYLLTPRSRVLLEKLTGFQLVKKFPAFYGTGGFITEFTSVRHLSLS